MRTYAHLYFLITVLLLVIYYYTYTLMDELNTIECDDCLTKNYICNNLLITTPRILIFIIIIKSLIFIPLFENEINTLLLLEVVIYILFLLCLYKTMSNLLTKKCKCVEKNKVLISTLLLISKIGLASLLLTLFILLQLILLYNRTLNILRQHI